MSLLFLPWGVNYELALEPHIGMVGVLSSCSFSSGNTHRTLCPAVCFIQSFRIPLIWTMFARKSGIVPIRSIFASSFCPQTYLISSSSTPPFVYQEERPGQPCADRDGRVRRDQVFPEQVHLHLHGRKRRQQGSPVAQPRNIQPPTLEVQHCQLGGKEHALVE